jgi:transcriptional regulator with XRE-family HTH domain
MPCSLAEFHFNSVKLGQILQRFAEQCGMGKGAVSRMTGISRDTITNIYNGDTQEVSFEKVFKMCVAFGVPMIAFEKLGVLGEDTDFADKIVMYDTASGEVLPATEVDIKDMPVPDTVVAVAEAVAAVENPPQPTPNTRTKDEYITFLQAHIERLTAMLDKAISKG